ncbi:MAG: peptidase M20, partial [Rhodobacter sp.]|nr:peptidase M20 [Rhodobacter sp.]
PQAIDVVRRAAAIAVGVNELQHVSDFRACDDVAVMMRIVQARGGIAGYFGLGTTMDGPHHNPRFDLDEDSLVVGLSVFLNILIELGNIPRAQ